MPVNITDSPLAQDSVLHAALHETLSRHADVNLVVFDAEGKLCALHGVVFDTEYSSRFVAGRNIDEVFADIPEHGRLYWKALQHGIQSEARYRGLKVWFSMHIMPLYGNEGQRVGVVGVGEDITAAVFREDEKIVPKTLDQPLVNLMDNSQDAIIMLDRNYVVQRVNPTMRQFNTSGAIEGERCYERFFDMSAPCPFCPVTECFRTGKTEHSRCFHPRLERHFSLQGVPLFDTNSGELIGAFEICRDTTDLHEFEQAMLMLEVIPLCCCLFNKDLRMIECNREAVEFFQCNTREEACNQFQHMFPAKQPDGQFSAFVTSEDMRRAFRCGRHSAEWIFELKTGARVPAHVDLVPVRHGGEELLAVYARDLREEKAMRAEAEEAQERIRVMFEAAPFGCTMSDRNFQSIDCNPTILHMHGLKDKAHYIERFLELSPPVQPCGRPSGEMALEQLNKAFDEGYTQFEWMHRTIKGEELPAEITMIRVMVNGKPLAAGYVRDLRELKKAQAELDRERAELVLAKEAAEAASRTKSTFLANMSHEIRTPMNAILGLAYLAMQGDVSQEQRENFRRIHSAATGLLGIINDILDFSKIEAHKLVLEAIPFLLSEQLSDISEIIRVRAQEKSIDLYCRMDETVCSTDYLIGDAGRLRQVLLNLLGNAVKFTEKGGVVFEVSVESRCASPQGEADTVTLNFAVMDTGIGIANDALRTLFKPFSQADGSITRRFGGTGLGLAITRQLVEAMGGQVRGRSDYGNGSEFIVTLPFTVCSAAVPSAPRHAVATDTQRLQGLRVLVVEDNDINQIVTVSLLERVGMVARCAENGLLALEILKNESFDVVLMDIQMPVMDGLEATRRLRALGQTCPALRTLPVVAMTAHAMSEDHAKSIEAGMNDHITKPIDPARLYATLCRWVG